MHPSDPDKILSFEVTPEIAERLEHTHHLIREAAVELEDSTRSERDYLNKYALIANVGATTRIENAVLTDVEVEWMDAVLSEAGSPLAFLNIKKFFFDRLSSDKQQSIEEVVGSWRTLRIVYWQATSLLPLWGKDVKNLHKQLLRFHPPADSYAGDYKTADNCIVEINGATGRKQIVLEPAAAGTVTKEAMHELLVWYNEAIKAQSLQILVAVEFVFRFLAIHPFEDGNGRMGRALFILSLLQSKVSYLESVIPLIAIDRRIEKNLARYYTVLQQGSDGKYHSNPAKYDYEPLVLFSLDILEEAIGDISHYREQCKYLERQSQSTLKVLGCFKSNPGKELRFSNIEEATKLPQRTIQFSLKTLTERSFLRKLGNTSTARYRRVV